MTRGDDMRVPTQDFLDVFSKATERVLEEDEGDDISRILLMIRRLFSVTIDEEEDSEDEEQNDCTRIAEMLEICTILHEHLKHKRILKTKVQP